VTHLIVGLWVGIKVVANPSATLSPGMTSRIKTTSASVRSTPQNMIVIQEPSSIISKAVVPIATSISYWYSKISSAVVSAVHE